MPIYINPASELIQDHERSLAVTCPHCEVTSHITVSAVPRFAALEADKPATVGIVYSCDACHSPVFLRYAVRAYRPDRIELVAQFVEVERPREKFTFTHLPEDVEEPFREALICFSNGAYNAFASMCRRAGEAVFADLGESGKSKLLENLNDVRTMAEIDTQTFLATRNVIFGTPTDPHAYPPRLDSATAAVVLEVMKDLLYEAYVRKGRLQQALMVRRYFAEETADDLTPVIAKSVSLREPSARDPLSSP